MSSSSTISLFSEQSEFDRKPHSFLFSFLAHGLAIGLILLGIATAPKVKAPVIAQRYEVRHLDLHSLDSEMQQARNELEPPAPKPQTHQARAEGSAPAPPAAIRMVIQAPPGAQTLLQPDLPKPPAIKVEIPVPTVVIWAPKKIQVKTIVPPLPQKPIIAQVRPSIQAPNDEPILADVAFRSSAMNIPLHTLLPSTTTPLVVSGPKPTPPAPITTAQGSALSTPTAVLSLSEHHMANGAVTLPPINSSVSSSATGTLAPAQPKNSAQNGQGSPDSKATGQGAGDARNTGHTGPGSANSQAAGKGTTGANVGSATGQAGYGQGKPAMPGHISRPREGQFSSVVVGTSLEEKYPETADLMSGKMSYTVYLHLGLAKSWILQYSLPRSAQSGTVSHIDAPWPYEIQLPTIAAGSIDADALIIHGFINTDGRFEALAVAFPPEYAQARYVLNALNQWQFRSAAQNGQNVKVEILLIIPETEQ